MPKDKITEYDVTALNNSDVGGVNIAENCPFGNVNNAIRELQSHLAETNAGTYPVADTWTFGDPADLTKRYRLDAGSITAGATRVITVPDQNGTMVLTTGAQDLAAKTFVDSTDVTKKLAFALSGISTGTTRTITWPNASGTVMLAGSYPTITSLEGLSLVSGDILYATAADTLARLAKGTDGQYLTLASGIPAWVSNPAWTYGSSWTTTSGTAFSETSIPSTATEIEILFFGVSTSLGADLLIRIGTSGGIQSTSYVSTTSLVSSAATFAGSNSTAFHVGSGSASGFTTGKISISRHGTSGTFWVSEHNGFRDGSNTVQGGGYKDLGGVLTQVQLTISSGTFDGGFAIARWR